jgi:hypothetical protein
MKVEQTFIDFAQRDGDIGTWNLYTFMLSRLA